MSQPAHKNSMHVDLFTPFTMGTLQLKNRIVMAPLTRNRAGEGNIPQDMNVEYYRQRASAGLIITEATQVSAQGVGYPGTPGIVTHKQIEGWKRVTEAVHAEGGLIFLQLFHAGRISHPQLQANAILPVAPSAIRPAGEAMTYTGLQPYVTPRALENEEIQDVVEQFRDASLHAKQAGFDGVEIHAANGYLLDQFLRDASNQREDEYGGSIENRARLLFQVIREVSEIWNSQRIGVRLSPINTFNDISDSDPKRLFDQLVCELNRFGLAYLHIIESSFAESGVKEKEVDFSELSQLYHGIYMVNGGYDVEKGNSAVREAYADLVAYGVSFLANPDLPRRLAEGLPLNAADMDTFYGGDEHGYTDYPFYEKARMQA